MPIWPKGEPHMVTIEVVTTMDVVCESRVHADYVLANLTKFYEEQPHRIETLNKHTKITSSIRKGGSGIVANSESRVN